MTYVMKLYSQKLTLHSLQTKQSLKERHYCPIDENDVAKLYASALGFTMRALQRAFK